MSAVKDKVIWITGASSGIGEALAVALSAKGARLILSARREHELRRVKDQCKSKEIIHILPTDITSFKDHQAVTTKAISLFGHVDMLINNAGISQRSFVKDTKVDVYKTLMDINYFGAVSLTKELLPHFLSRKTG